MANAASKDKVQADLDGPDYKGTLDLLRNRVKAKKSKVGEINGEISGIYDQIEKKGVNKQGCRIFLRLDDMEVAERNDVLRTVQELAKIAGWDNTGDMLDKAASNVVEMPGVKGAAPQPPAQDDGEQGDVDVDAKCEPAEWKAAYVEHMVEQSEMKEPDAYVLANKAFDSLTTAQKKNLTRRQATTEAENDMADWPEVPTQQ